MLKAGVLIDAWKLPIFERHLSDAGFSYEQAPGVTPDTITLRIMTASASVEGLRTVVRAANAEAAARNKK
jgi:hypothetical protein